MKPDTKALLLECAFRLGWTRGISHSRWYWTPPTGARQFSTPPESLPSSFNAFLDPQFLRGVWETNFTDADHDKFRRTLQLIVQRDGPASIRPGSVAWATEEQKLEAMISATHGQWLPPLSSLEMLAEMQRFADAGNLGMALSVLANAADWHATAAEIAEDVTTARIQWIRIRSRLTPAMTAWFAPVFSALA